jgi:hypothetical protein
MKMTCMPVLCLGLITISNCNPHALHGSGVSKTETRSVGSFSKIDLAGSPDVMVAVGSDTSVSVTTDDNLLTNIETVVEGDTLRINSRRSYNTSVGVKVNITVPDLNGVSISGSGDIQVTGLKAGDMDASVTGSGDITLSGVMDRLHAHIVGSGDVRASELAVKHVRVDITGSGDAEVRATEELDASVTGSGDVRYSGQPPQVRRSITGSGDIAPR